VGRPVAVNPDRYLRDLAAERGWPVQDFRRRRRLWLVWLPAGATTAAAAVTGRRLARRRGRGRPAGAAGRASARRGRRGAGRPR
jgi:hypothetical protein